MRTLWIVAVWLMGVEGHLLQFENMIYQKTGKFAIIAYSNYGCYCGWGGKGKPQDATDRCCFVHDCCYGRVNGCDPKADSYSYSFENGDIVCGIIPEKINKQSLCSVLRITTAARITFTQYWKNEGIPPEEEVIKKILECAEMDRLTMRLKDKEETEYYQRWKSFYKWLEERTKE